MNKFRISHEWSSYEDPLTEVGETTARVGIYLDKYCLTKNHDIFSKTVRDQIHVSLYPLAMWFASSWWRLNYEVLPDSARKTPSHDWRMSHEMAAANMGFVWPHLVFAPDDDRMQIWAQASQRDKEEAVSFLNGLDYAQSVPKHQFFREVSSLINEVIARLHEVGCGDTELAAIWGFVIEDLKVPDEHLKRRMEAVLGFDPECCPEELVAQAIGLEQEIGSDALSELSGAYAVDAGERVNAIKRLIEAEGLVGKPDPTLHMDLKVLKREPWEIAVSAAREVRKKIGNTLQPLDNSILYDLLGLPAAKIKDWLPVSQARASIAGPEDSGKLKFVPRRKHPTAQRFELARFVGDYLRTATNKPEQWLVSADLSTARQKFQRAFAAEFLCPISSLVEYLNGDFSEPALEDAATHFMVSERTIDSLLMNNGYLPRFTPDDGMPYRLTG